MNKVTLETPEFVSWFNRNQKRIEMNQKRKFPSLTIPKLSVSEGKRYLIIRRDNSAHAFVDKDTGDIFKPASFRAPAKGARGNIFNSDNGLDCMGPYGPAYIRGTSYGFEPEDCVE